MTVSASTSETAPTCLAPGDVVEILTPSGLAYLQVTHLHHAYPEIVRALPGLHARRPDSLNLLVQLPTRFIAITPLAASLGRDSLDGETIGRWPVPDSERAFPRFRMPIHDSHGQVVYWWHWDGDTLNLSLEDDQASNLPIREVLHPDELLNRLINED